MEQLKLIPPRPRLPEKFHSQMVIMTDERDALIPNMGGRSSKEKNDTAEEVWSRLTLLTGMALPRARTTPDRLPLMFLLIAYVLLALGTSFVCSILEAVLLSVSIYELMPLADKGDAGASRMITLKRERADDAITSILVLNTIAHTIGATLAGAQAATVFGSQWVGVFSAVLTLLILVGTEIIPKTAGHAYARQLAGTSALVINTLTRMLSPIVAMSRLLTRLIAPHNEEGRVSRSQLSAMIAAARQQGVLHSDEWKRLKNLLSLEAVRVSDTMTPRTVVVMMSASATIHDLLQHERARAFSRIPLYGESIDEVLGYVFTREVFRAAAEGLDHQTPLRDLMREIVFVQSDASVRDVMTQLLERREPLAVALDGFGGVSGLVTVEDIIETILGEEIHDEEGQALDLRELAVSQRERRLAELRAQGRILADSGEDAQDGKSAQ